MVGKAEEEEEEVHDKGKGFFTISSMNAKAMTEVARMSMIWSAHSMTL